MSGCWCTPAAEWGPPCCSWPRRGGPAASHQRSRAKLVKALELDLDGGVHSTVPELVADVRRATGHGAHAAVDLVGGALFARTLEMLRPRGPAGPVGLTAGRTAQVDLSLILRHRLWVEGTVLRSRPDEEKSDLMAGFRASVLPLLEARAVRPVVDPVFPFADVEAPTPRWLPTRTSASW